MSAAEILESYLIYFLLLLGLLLLLLVLLLRVLLQTQKKLEDVTRNETGPLLKGSNVYSPSSPAEGDLEKILDFVLRNVSRCFAQQCTEIELPNFHRSSPVMGSMQCSLWMADGVVGDVSSLFRDGPARVHEVLGEELIVDAAVGLRNIELRYNDYFLDVWRFSLSGSVQVNVAPVSLRMRVLIRPSFAAELQSLSVENLGPVKLNITGIGLRAGILSFVESWINRNYFPYIQDIALQHLSHALENTLQSFSRKMETIPQLMSCDISTDFSSENAEVKYSMEKHKRKRIEDFRRKTIGESFVDSVHITCNLIKMFLLVNGVPVHTARVVERKED